MKKLSLNTHNGPGTVPGAGDTEMRNTSSKESPLAVGKTQYLHNSVRHDLEVTQRKE